MTFDAFWKLYPRRIGKFAARTAWYRAIGKHGAKPEEVIEGVKRYIAWLGEKTPKTWRPEPKHAATWLNQGCWLDELSTTSRAIDENAARRQMEANKALGINSRWV